MQLLPVSDIQQSLLYTHEPANGATRSWPMPERLASFALTQHDDRLLLGPDGATMYYCDSQERVINCCDYDPASGECHLGRGEADLVGTRRPDRPRG